LFDEVLDVIDEALDGKNDVFEHAGVT